MRIGLMRGMRLVGWLLVLSRREIITESDREKEVGRKLEDQVDW